MADLLPSNPDTTKAPDGDPRVIGVDSDDADNLLGALSSSTARKILSELHDEPATPSALADHADTSVQNAQYHLTKLEDADLIAVVDTCYSEKGREMDVYAPTDGPLVVFAGTEENTTGLKDALSRMLGAIGALGLASLVVQQLYGGGLGALFEGGTSQPPVAMESSDVSMETATTTTATADRAASTVAGALPPGLVFFAGGLLVLALGFAWWYLRHRR